MSSTQEKPWSDNPNAPKISLFVYHFEKASFAGAFICSILYGIVIALFFKCIAALSNPNYRKGERIKWGLVFYTVAIFSVVTIQTAMNLDITSIAYIDNRNFPGIEGELPPGPYGYEMFMAAEALNVIPNVMFLLNDWLADGIMLYRCYVIYSQNLWVIAFPCLMYLGSVALGTAFVYYDAKLINPAWSGLSYLSISFSLNVILTLMIVIRLILHTRRIRTTMGKGGIGESSKAVVTMLVESGALFAVSLLLVLGTWGAKNYVAESFFPILSETQVIAPLLVILRVADKSAFTSDTGASGLIGSSKTMSWGEFTGGSSTLPGGNTSSSVGRRKVDSYELGIKIETTTDCHEDT